jgi:glucan-binding YG repeat protein
MGISAIFYPVTTSFAAEYDKVDGHYQMDDGTVLWEVLSRGIDVSRWQGDVDWETVAKDDVSFVMLGTRSKGNVDPKFHTNVKEASDAGLKVGAYIYSLADTPDKAREEADFVLDLVKDYPISFPIAFDAEDNSTLGTLSPEEVSEVINAFCDRVKDAGYYPIVYANDYWLAHKIDLSTMNYDVWVARYKARHKYSDPIMWQVTSSGSIEGINGNVDIDFLYRDLSPQLPSNLWRTIGAKTYYYQNYSMQKDAWIHDGTGWFYMNKDGQADTGWFYQNDLSYYLDDNTGRMVTRWKRFANDWYFFDLNGSMHTNWLTDNDKQYYLYSDGIMATGWLHDNQQYYYLNPKSGEMTIGWKSVDNKEYYFHDNGIMATGWLDYNGKRYYLNSDGAMLTGWCTIDSSKYYLENDGAASIGWKLLDNSWYYFDSTGLMTTGWIHPDQNWYSLGNDGKMLSGWLKDKGKTYYLSETSGRMIVGWRQIDGSWYYFNGSGAMVTGLSDINGQTYYLNPEDGKMAADTTFDLAGVSYTADANGVCSQNQETDKTQSEDSQSTDATVTGPDSQGPGSHTTKSTEKTTKEIGPGIH